MSSTMSSISRYRLAAWNHRIDNDMITNQIEASIHLNAHQPMESPCHAASPAPPAVFCSTSMGRGHYSLLSAADSADEQGGGAALMFLNDAANELFITSAAVSFGNDTNRYSQVVTDDDIKDFSSQMMTNKPHKTQVIGAILESSAAGPTDGILPHHSCCDSDSPVICSADTPYFDKFIHGSSSFIADECYCKQANKLISHYEETDHQRTTTYCCLEHQDTTQFSTTSGAAAPEIISLSSTEFRWLSTENVGNFHDTLATKNEQTDGTSLFETAAAASGFEHGLAHQFSELDDNCCQFFTSSFSACRTHNYSDGYTKTDVATELLSLNNARFEKDSLMPHQPQQSSLFSSSGSRGGHTNTTSSSDDMTAVQQVHWGYQTRDVATHASRSDAGPEQTVGERRRWLGGDEGRIASCAEFCREETAEFTSRKRRKPQICSVCKNPRFSSPGHTNEGWCPIHKQWGARSTCGICNALRRKSAGHLLNGYCPVADAYAKDMLKRWLKSESNYKQPWAQN